MPGFDHEKLEFYNAAVHFVAHGEIVIERLPKGRAYLADQLHRAAASIPLDIAEGAGESSGPEKAASIASPNAPRRNARPFSMYAGRLK